MSEDLFPESVQKSPYLEFVEQHGIQIRYEKNSHPQDMDWHAWIGSSDLKFDIPTSKNSFCIGFGLTEKDAVFNLATKLNLKGWRAINW